jgi:hypothetical protein
MSFDVHFQPCRFDGTTSKRTNPFTKQVQDIPHNQPLSQPEVDAVRQVLTRAGATSPDEHGRHVVRFGDGSSVEVFGSDLANGCMFAIRGAGITASLAQLLFDVMVAGNWVIMGEDDVVVAPTRDCLKGVPRGFPRVVVAASGPEVAALLSGGFEEWKKYRDS